MNCEGQSQDSMHRPQLLKMESRSGLIPRSICLPALPLGQTGSLGGGGGGGGYMYESIYMGGGGMKECVVPK